MNLLILFLFAFGIFLFLSSRSSTQRSNQSTFKRRTPNATEHKKYMFLRTNMFDLCSYAIKYKDENDGYRCDCSKNMLSITILISSLKHMGETSPNIITCDKIVNLMNTINSRKICEKEEDENSPVKFTLATLEDISRFWDTVDELLVREFGFQEALQQID